MKTRYKWLHWNVGKHKDVILYIMLMICVVSFTGCGFRPLYGPQSQSSLEETAYIFVDNIPDYLGMRLKNNLNHSLLPDGRLYPTKYTLDIKLKSSERNKGFRLDSSVSTSEITLVADFKLVDRQTKNVLFSDSVFAAGSYSKAGTASVAAIAAPASVEAAEGDALRLVTQFITERIIAYFNTKAE